MLLGLDFDNTLIKYDELFFKVAREKNLIEENFIKDKIKIRDFLRSEGKEDDWTIMQGEVYGPRINEALPFCNMFEVLTSLKNKGVEMCLVSHKTKTPYLGEPHDMHAAALGWLKAKGFFDAEGLGWKSENIYFELTKEKKIQRIQDLRCDYFIDDLPEILEMLPNNINKILFSPQGTNTKSRGWVEVDSWLKISAILA
tara:strand:- start:134 stop:730 length:597 start_codon:yes stop_codon:yes gene_type:complete